jgi:hypothetical protein
MRERVRIPAVWGVGSPTHRTSGGVLEAFGDAVRADGSLGTLFDLADSAARAGPWFHFHGFRDLAERNGMLAMYVVYLLAEPRALCPGCGVDQSYDRITRETPRLWIANAKDLADLDDEWLDPVRLDRSRFHEVTGAAYYAGLAKYKRASECFGDASWGFTNIDFGGAFGIVPPDAR